MTIRAYHFHTGRLRDGRPIPPLGEWLEHTGDVVICQSGLHASRHPADALTYAPGPYLDLVECDGIVTEHEDKLACSRRRRVATIDATPLLVQYAGECAALACWCAGLTSDVYQRAVLATQSYAAGDLHPAELERIWDAARDAASDAARAAASDAARAAASDAAWAAAGVAAWAAAGVAAWAAAKAAAGDAMRARFAALVAEALP